MDPDQSINEIILANCNTIAPSALHGNAWGGPTSEDVWTLFGTFIIDVPPSPSSMFSSESLDQDNTANSVPSPREDHPTAPSPPPEIPYQEVPSGTPPLHLFYTPDRDIHAAKVDLINFARAPWAEQIPSELLLAFLERVPLPKATRGKGARKGAKGYYCHWPGCNKTDMTLRLDHAKAHVARHIDSKPHKCSDWCVPSPPSSSIVPCLTYLDPLLCDIARGLSSVVLT